MNFFEDQDRARKQTQNLIFWFILTVMVTSALIGFLIMFFLIEYQKTRGIYPPVHDPYNLDGIAAITVVCGFIILMTSLFKTLIMGSGGAYVAKLMGAKEVDLDTNDPKLRQFINVVEEMTIASGMPMPELFYLDREEGINAFAAGTTIHNAVVCVSRGCLDLLNRDELQGVVAHEFSHIFNGDMKLNIKLIGYLAGLMSLVHIGRIILRSTRYSSNRKSGGIAIFAIVFFVIGGIGYFFAAVIKAAISRQREFLADASAVQFTRNPDGIGGALKKIAVYWKRSLVDCASADEISHMFFAKGLHETFATHPPIRERLKAIYPQFDPLKFEQNERKKIEEELNNIKVSPFSKSMPEPQIDREIFDSAPQFAGTMDIPPIGRINPQDITKAHDFLQGLPKGIQQAFRQENGRQLIPLVLIYQPEQNHDEILRKDQGDLTYFKSLYDEVKLVPKDLRMSLLDRCIPTLKKMSETRKKEFLAVCREMIKADKKVSHWEWIFYYFLNDVLLEKDGFFDNHTSKTQNMKACWILFSYLANLDESKSKAKEIFEKGMQEAFGTGGKYQANQNLDNLSKALKIIHRARPRVKEAILLGSIKIIEHNGKLHHKEYETLKLLAEIMDIPLPAKF
jgi:Zn-dependent protease with chaperone function